MIRARPAKTIYAASSLQSIFCVLIFCFLSAFNCNSSDHNAPAASLHPSPSFALFPEHFVEEHFDHLFQRARFPLFKVGTNDCLAVQRSFRATAPRRLILTRKPSTAFRDVCAPHISALAFLVTYSLSCAV
jgi:hypothetical protein